MAKRRSKSEIREEYVRLAKVFDFINKEEIAFARKSGDAQYLAILGNSSLDQATLLEEFDTITEVTSTNYAGETIVEKITPSMHLAGLREAVWDTLIGVQEAMADPFHDPDDDWIRGLPHRYQQQTGRNIFVDAGDPARHAKFVIKRGQIETEEEWRMMHDILSDTEQKLLTSHQAEIAEQLMLEFESVSGPTGSK